MIVYKVLRKDKKSAWALGKGIVTYKIDKWVSAPKWLAKLGYYLLAFRTLKDAKKFDDLYGVLPTEDEICLLHNAGKIYRAEARGTTKKMPKRVNNTYTETKTGFINWLNRYGESWGFPEGTVMCKEIKLIKEV